MVPELLQLIFSVLCIHLSWTTGWNTSLLKTKRKGSCSHPNISCDNSKCITQFRLCDGKNDCIDGMDESLQFCGIKVTCPDMFFNCKVGEDNTPGECIPHESRCDGKIDCFDASDEVDCHIKPTCEGFTCISGECLSSDQVCDGVGDCDDGEDENHCKFECGKGLFKCNQLHQCVNETKLCDNVKDCDNGADEPDICNINECHSKQKRCSQNCRDLPIGYHCSCYDGYELALDLHDCQDVNECLFRGSCSQLCYNVEGGYNCDCKDGYKLIGRSRCEAIGEKMFFLLSEGTAMVKLVPNKLSSHQTLVNSFENVGAISYSVTLGYVYWSDTKKHLISRFNFLRPNQVEVVVSDVGAPEGLAVDWVAYKLYWTDGSRKTIEVSELDGSHRTVLVSHGLTYPKSIALDPRRGYRYIYWTDWGRIERISLDGELSTRSAIYNHGLDIWNGLLIDFGTDHLYWFEEFQKSIESGDLAGKKHQIFNLNHKPTSLAVFEDYVYWTGQEKDKMFWINKLNGEQGVHQYVSVSNPKYLTPVHEVMQPEVERPKDDIHCTHLKLLSHTHGYKCVCPESLYLLLDGRTCNTSDAFTCHPGFCYHGGTCYKDKSDALPKCQCPLEFNGSRCENKVDVGYPVFRDNEIVQYKCLHNYCYNQGTCVEFSSEYDILKPKCLCSRGYYGSRCEYYYGYMLRSVNIEDAQGEKSEVMDGKVDVLPDRVTNIAACVSALFVLICISLMFVIHRLLRNLPSYDIVVNPIYRVVTEDESNDEVVVNVEALSSEQIS